MPGDSSPNVQSNFEVDGNAENKGGLRVCLAVTLTASGLAVPPYIAVTKLTDAELSPEMCPDRILAVKVPGLCKGGRDIHNSGFGWLVFCRADKKDSSNSLSIANKKFIHYNDNVFMPFLREIRKKLGRQVRRSPSISRLSRGLMATSDNSRRCCVRSVWRSTTPSA